MIGRITSGAASFEKKTPEKTTDFKGVPATILDPGIRVTFRKRPRRAPLLEGARISSRFSLGQFSGFGAPLERRYLPVGFHPASFAK